MTRPQRLAFFATTVFVTVFGLGEFVRWVVNGWAGVDWWGIDLHLVIDAGARWTAGQPIYANPAFLYPPLAALIGAPMTILDFDWLSVAYALLKIAIAVGAVLRLTPGWSAPSRVMAIAALVCCLPFMHDLMLGNANVVLVAAMAVAMLGPARPRSGILLGLATAIFAKPLVVPVLLWLLVRRRSVLVATAVTGLLATGVGLLITGPGAYVDWVSALAGGTRYASPFAGNHGITAIVPGLWLPVAIVTFVGLVVVLVRRGPSTGITWASTSGLLLAPYAGTYAALPMALAIPGIARLAPTMALVIVAVSPVATTHPLPIYAAAVLIGSLFFTESTGPRP
jgi:alpha-1,2-mannosyltransferase